MTICALFLSHSSLQAETLRIATFNVELQRKGPGLLLRDIQAGSDEQVAHVLEVVRQVNPDILVLQGFDWDYHDAALRAFADALRDVGVALPHRFAARPNSGMATGLDLDGDGYRGDASDAQGFGRFSGDGGVALLSRPPIRQEAVEDYTSLLWRDMPGALLPTHEDGEAFPSDDVQEIQRLSSTVHWVVPVELQDGTLLRLMIYQAGPPVFDGPEDRNGRRNHDENRFWQLYLDGVFSTPPTHRFVLAGGANLDPSDGEGRREAILSLLADPRLQDPAPASPGAAIAADQGHAGRNDLDTVDWEGVGRLRVDYLLPSADLQVRDSGVFWPAPGMPGHEAALGASRHRLVWIDLTLP